MSERREIELEIKVEDLQKELDRLKAQNEKMRKALEKYGEWEVASRDENTTFFECIIIRDEAFKSLEKALQDGEKE